MKRILLALFMTAFFGCPENVSIPFEVSIFIKKEDFTCSDLSLRFMEIHSNDSVSVALSDTSRYCFIMDRDILKTNGLYQLRLGYSKDTGESLVLDTIQIDVKRFFYAIDIGRNTLRSVRYRRVLPDTPFGDTVFTFQ